MCISHFTHFFPSRMLDTAGKVLNLWVKRARGMEEDKIACARSAVSHINLVYIDPIHLKHVVSKCGFVEQNDVNAALEEIDLMSENESPDDKERVIVEGAGDDSVNGIYVLVDDEIGLNANEVMFLKEVNGENDCLSSGFGLYRWEMTWGISSCADYSNLLYSCTVDLHKGHSLQKPPKWGWKCRGGPEKGKQ